MSRPVHAPANEIEGSRRATDAIGAVLGGRYRLISVVGSGAKARVFVGEDLKARRRVAVKCLHAPLAQDRQVVDRFFSEAALASGIEHPNLLKVIDWGQDGGFVYLVTDVLTGGSLHDIIHSGRRLEPEQALLVGLQVAQGLRSAHHSGIVHRDVKPTNLLFGDEGRLRVADMVIADGPGEGPPVGIDQGSSMGARYAPPERYSSAELTTRADVYSLVICLIEAVTGAVPLLGESARTTMLLRSERDIAATGALDALGVLGKAIEPAGRANPESRPDIDTFIGYLTSAARSLPRPDRLPLVSLRERSDTPLPANNLSLSRPVLDEATNTSNRIRRNGAGARSASPMGVDTPTSKLTKTVSQPETTEGTKLDAAPQRKPLPARDTHGGSRRGPVAPQLVTQAQPEPEPESEPEKVDHAVPDLAKTVDGVVGPLTAPPFVGVNTPIQPGVAIEDLAEIGVYRQPTVDNQQSPSDTPMSEERSPEFGGAAFVPHGAHQWSSDGAGSDVDPQHGGTGHGWSAPNHAEGDVQTLASPTPPVSAPAPSQDPAPGGVWSMGRVGSPADRGRPVSQSSTNSPTVDGHAPIGYELPASEPASYPQQATGQTGSAGVMATGSVPSYGAGYDHGYGANPQAAPSNTASSSTIVPNPGPSNVMAPATGANPATQGVAPDYVTGGSGSGQQVWSDQPNSEDTHGVPSIPDHYWGHDSVQTGYIPHSLALGVAGRSDGDYGHNEGHHGSPASTEGRDDSAWYLPTVLVGGLVCTVALMVGLVVAMANRSDNQTLSGDSMTDYVGRQLDDVRPELEEQGWKLVVKLDRQDGTEPGEIIVQSPLPGTDLDPGGTIHLTVSEGPGLREVPSLVGKAVAEATSLIEGAGLSVGAVTERHDESVAVGRVLDVRIDGSPPEVGVESGTKLDLVVSAGPTARIMPDLVGLDFEKIDEATEPLGLAVTTRQAYSSSQPAGQVVSTEPEANATVQRGTEIIVTVSLGPKPQEAQATESEDP